MRFSNHELRDLLDAALAAESGTRRPVARVERRVAPYHSSWQMEDVDVTYADGGHESLVVKDLSPDATLPEAREVKPAGLVDPRREVEVYRRLLRHHDLGTPRFRGASIEPAEGRCLLTIEQIDATPLWQIGEFETWRSAARWLARLHATATARAIALADAAHLLRYDAAYYERWIQRAHRAAGSDRCAEPHAVRRLAAAYERATPLLLAFAPAFIHGEFQASNVLVERRADGPIIRPVDWEMAALGPALMDLADLAGGWVGPQRRELLGAYAEAAGESDLSGIGQSLELCRLHRAVQWAVWTDAEWHPPAAHARDWLGEACRIAEEIGP